MFLQEQIANLQRRLRNIETNPLPQYLKCNKLRYEMELERYQHSVDAWKAGKPFAILEGAELMSIPLGFEHQGHISWGDKVTNPRRYYDIAVNKLGFPEHSCDRTLTALGLFLSGEVPTPRLMLSRRIPCDPEKYSLLAAAKYSGVLFFELDRRHGNGYENIACLAEQVGEMIEYAEKSVPGIKFDEDKLWELIDLDSVAINYLRDTYELRKRVPCPISAQDAFRLMSSIPSRHPNPPKVAAYMKAYRDEMFERADKGIGGVKEEKLRIAWLATGPYGRETFDLLARKGVSLPWFHYGAAAHLFGVIRNDARDDNAYGRKLTALEEVVRRLNANIWGGNADDWVNPLLKVCRDLKIDAVVDFMQPGCITTKNLKRITSQRLKNELGIPTLDLDGREFFSTEASTSEMNRKLEEFVDICIANKEHGRPLVEGVSAG